MSRHSTISFLVSVSFAVAACASSGDTADSDGVDDSFLTGKADTANIADDSPDAVGVLRLVNEASQSTLDDDVGLDARAAAGIITYRAGSDKTLGNGDDRTFDTLVELDAVPYVGPVAFRLLLTYARAHGFVPVAHDPIVLDDSPIPIDYWYPAIQFLGNDLYLGTRRTIGSTVTTLDLAHYTLGDHGPTKLGQTADAYVMGLGTLVGQVLIYGSGSGYDLGRHEQIPLLATGDQYVNVPDNTSTAGEQIASDSRGNVYTGASFKSGAFGPSNQIQISVRSPSVGWMARLARAQRPSASGPFGVDDHWLVVNNRTALAIYDVSDPSNPQLARTIPMATGVDLLFVRPILVGNHVVVAAAKQLAAYDVVTGARTGTLDVAEPVQWAGSGTPCVVDDTLYIGGVRSIFTIEVSGQGQLSLTRSFVLTTDPAAVRVGAIQVVGSRLYAVWNDSSVGSDATGEGGHHLTTVDLGL